jgi:glycosyltransferase involved in cell wall biosynthesis
MLGSQMSRATIIITSYNQPVLLRFAYASARRQTWTNTQIIIADDNSDDPRVLEYLSALSDDPNLVVFNSNVSDEDRPKTARYATQINTAVQLFADGDYLFFLPDDDKFLETKVEEQVKAMFINGWDVTYGSQSIRDIDLERHTIGHPKLERIADKVLDDAYNIVDHGQVCVSRAAFDKVGGWPDDPEYWSGADAYFWRRLSAAGYKFYPVPTARCVKNDMDGVQARVFSGRKPWAK